MQFPLKKPRQNKPVDIRALAAALKHLQPGYLPLSIFLQVARLTATPIIEIVPVRAEGHSVQVLMLRRPPDDPVWPSLLHTPGTVIRATDACIQEGIDRILEDELPGTRVGTPVFVETLIHQSARGTEVAQIYWAEVHGKISAGEFCNVEDMPEDDIVSSQVEFIKRAVDHYINRAT
jgi:hypothetical protein